MKRFVKVALLLAAMALAVSAVAFAAPLKLPGELVTDYDVRLISDDMYGTKLADSLVASVDADGNPVAGTDLLDFDVVVSDDAFVVANDFGVFSDDATGSFDKIIVRSTFANDVPFEFVVSPDGAVDPFLFGLRGGAEKTVPFDKRVPSDDIVATDCTIACETFYFYMQDREVSNDIVDFPGYVRWTGTGDKEYYVECCDYFGLVASTDADVFASASRDFVVAHLSETPFLRVRTADGFNVGPDSKDFRAADWSTKFFNTTGAVDVPEGKTYHMGVVYADAGDCVPCDGWVCDDANLPYVAVTNLGTESVWVEPNLTASPGLVIDGTVVEENESWLCNTWCGLCEFDDFMSSDHGTLAVGESINDRSTLWDCACHIFPAYSETWKGAGNMDWNFRAYKSETSDVVTRVDGRFNTAWTGGSLTTSGICDSCEESGHYIYWPCECAVEIYETTLGTTPLTFAEKTDVTFEFAADTVAGSYFSRNAVLSVTGWDEEAGTNDVVVAKLEFALDGDNLSDAGLLDLAEGQWWREEFWSKLSVSVNGHALNAANVESVGDAPDFTADELAFLAVVDGPQRTLSTTSDVDVDLFVFVMDSDTDAVKYYKTSTGNRFLVVFDGAKDGKFSYEFAISKADAPVPAKLAVTPTELKLYLDSTTTGTVKAQNATGTVKWTVDQSEEFVSISPDQGAEVTVTALKVTPGNVKVIATDDKTSADCVVTVDAKKPVSPDQPGGGSSGGCSMGFAPAALLLLAPLFFLKK